MYALGRYLKIPESILKAAPTDGLFGDSRTDEEQLGASYDELEWAMLEAEKEINLKDFSEHKAAVIVIYKRLNKANQHKMQAIPVCEIPEFLK